MHELQNDLRYGLTILYNEMSAIEQNILKSIRYRIENHGKLLSRIYSRKPP